MTGWSPCYQLGCRLETDWIQLPVGKLNFCMTAGCLESTVPVGT